MKRLMVFALLMISCAAVSAQQPTSGELVDSGMNPWKYIYQHLEKFACREYWERHEQMRSCQRRGYAEILSQICSDDPLFTLIEYIRMQLQLEYSLNHQPIHCRVILTLDWAYPADPWRRDPETHH